MLEIIAFIAIAVYTCTLPGRVRGALSGKLPAKFAGDPVRYRTNLRRESLIIVVCSAFWAVNDLVNVLWLKADVVAASGAAILLWAIIGGWLACAAGALIARRPLVARGAPTLPSPTA